MDLKVVLLLGASCNSYLEMEPERNSTLSYGIELLAIYDMRVVCINYIDSKGLRIKANGWI